MHEVRIRFGMGLSGMQSGQGGLSGVSTSSWGLKPGYGTAVAAAVAFYVRRRAPGTADVGTEHIEEMDAIGGALAPWSLGRSSQRAQGSGRSCMA